MFDLKSGCHLPEKIFYLLQWKMMKNAYFILKALFIIRICTFLSWLFDHVEKNAWLERYG